MGKMRQIIRTMAVMASCLPNLGLADGNKIVVELYTSQGCSSCPPADALLAKMSKDPEILALALHVDYWDYLGWTDKFARPAFTERQKNYAHASGERMIYTPQAIIGGKHNAVGSDAAAVMAAVMDLMQEPDLIDMRVTRSGNKAVVDAKALLPFSGPVDVLLIRFVPEQSVEIGHGENAGLTVKYVNIVTSWTVIGAWDGLAPLQMTLPVDGADKAAIVVQAAGIGAILAAAEVP